MRVAWESEAPNQFRRYVDFAYTHNERLRRLGRIECEAEFESHYSIEGRRYRDTGDATVWIDWPNKGLMNVRNLGECFLWLGHDSDQAWLFIKTDEMRTCWKARIRNIYNECCGKFPYGIAPNELTVLVGLNELPTDAQTFSFQNVGNEWVVTDSIGIARRRVYIDPSAGQILRTELIDSTNGNLLVTTTMAGYRAIDEAERSPDLRFPTRLEIFSPREESYLSIHVHYVKERREGFPSDAFRPNAIGLSMKTRDWVQLDANCEGSKRTEVESNISQSRP